MKNSLPDVKEPTNQSTEANCRGSDGMNICVHLKKPKHMPVFEANDYGVQYVGR